MNEAKCIIAERRLAIETMTVDQIKGLTSAELRRFACAVESQQVCRLLMAMADMKKGDSR